MKKFFTTTATTSAMKRKLAQNFALMNKRCEKEINLRKKKLLVENQLKTVSTENLEKTLEKAEQLKDHSVY